MSLASFVILATAIAGAAAQNVMVNTPTSVVQCLPVQLSWSGGQAPYYLSLIPGGQPTATPLEDLGQQTGTSFSWKADLPANTAVTVQIRDSAGVLNYSDQFTIQKAPSGTSCSSSGTTTGTANSSVATGTASASGHNASSTTTTPVTSTSGSTTAGSTTSNTSSSSPKTSGSTSSSSTTTPVAGTDTTGNSTSANAKSDASRSTAGLMAVAVAAAVAVFA